MRDKFPVPSFIMLKMSTGLVLYFLMLLAFDFTEGYRILGVFPLPQKSHFIMYEKLMKGLAEKGHTVDVVSHFPQKESKPRYNDLSVRGSMPLFSNNITIELLESLNKVDSIMYMWIEGGVEVCRTVLNTTTARDLKTKKIHYDLVITEIFGADCMLGYGHYFKTPVVSVISSVLLPWAGDRIGVPDNPAYIGSYFLPYTRGMCLLQRLENTLMILATKFGYNRYSMQESYRIAQEYFGKDLPNLEDLAANTSMILANSHFSINHARPLVPNLIEVGGLHIEPPKPLSKHFEEVVNIAPAYKGVIYLSMGSMFFTESLPLEKLQALLDTFSQLPYKVLWKADPEKFPKQLYIPANVHMELWYPQFDILCHPNTKLFITHGGLLGAQEAIYCGVPSLGVPLFADQELNIRFSEDMGIGMRMGIDQITKEFVLRAATSLLDDPMYLTNAQKISRRFKDRPISALDTAIYWIEYVIRHEGAAHLRSWGADLPFYQYYLLDVGAIIIATLLSICYMLYCLITQTWNFLICKRRTKLKSE